MNDKALDLEFYGRKKLSSSRKIVKYISGIILFLFGLFGLSQPNFGLNFYWYLLITGGILNIIHGLFGKDFQKNEPDAIYKELEMLKAKLIE